jgi:hypothetical protein
MMDGVKIGDGKRTQAQPAAGGSDWQPARTRRRAACPRAGQSARDELSRNPSDGTDCLRDSV